MTPPDEMERVNLKTVLGTIKSAELALSEVRRLIYESAFDKAAHRKHNLYQARLHANNARALTVTIDRNLMHEYDAQDAAERSWNGSPSAADA